MNRDDLLWFHGRLSRESAEEIIKEDGHENGTFLVRESNTAAGDFVLTLLYEGEVCHYQIRRHGEDAFFSIDDKVKILHGLDTLVEFYQTAENGLLCRLRAFIRKDPPPNDARSHGNTNLLHRATKENNHTIVSELLKCGYRNVDAKNQDGQTAVHLAALYCDEAILQLLLDAGVNVNCKDTEGNMPLHYACRSKSAVFIRILVKAGANVQGRNIKNGHVPLHDAALHGNLAAIHELLAAKAPLLPRTNFGEFPIDLAREARHEEVVTFLTNYKTPAASTLQNQWYHGTLSREEAVEALMTFAANMQSHEQQISSVTGSATTPTAVKGDEEDSPNETSDTVAASQENVDTSGCFLVRYSERKDSSGYVLTLLWNRNVKNFLILQSSQYLFIDDGPYLPSLEHLVEHFMRFADGLPVALLHPVLPKPKPPLPLFSTMPRSGRKLSESQLSPVSNEDRSVSDESQRKHSMPTPQQKDDNANMHKHSQTLTNPKKKHKEHNSVFNTLRLRSPKKSNIIDTLRKSKIKPKAKAVAPTPSPQSPPSREEELKQTQTLFKNLSFSTDFSSINMMGVPIIGGGGDAATAAIYNVPQNNSAIEETAPSSIPPGPEPPIISAMEPESKTDAEVEYFTQSDVAIERERIGNVLNGNVDEQCFQNRPARFAPNANGYIPTVDVRVFLDQGSVLTVEALEASAAELREFSKHPERLDSIISNVSRESEIMRFFNRQMSNISSMGGGDTSTPTSPNPLNGGLNYFIPYDCLELNTVLGVGEFGSVYSGTLIRPPLATAEGNGNTSGEDVRCAVAIKTLRDEHCRANKQEFLREASVMIRLQHHCIVQLIGISKGETLMMVQELVALGSMLEFLQQHSEKINANYELKVWASQIACGMQYLESHHFVHRDLAARNILLASRNQAKISDFGLSRALGSGNECYQASQGGKWPIKWYAPESYNTGIFSHASDVWSFGITLWEMFSLGEPPYGDIRGVEAIQMIESGGRLEQPANCPSHIYQIMQSCWHYKAKDRPSFHYLTEFFANDPDYQNIMELVKTQHIS